MKKMLTIARLLGAGAALGIATGALAQSAANYPNKPVRVILPYAPGGSTTAVTRIYSQKMSEEFNQSFIVDNRPGGNTIIGTEAMARAPADGYTILTITNSFVINHWLQPKLPYDTLKDFAGISAISRSDYMLGVHPSLPAKNLKEFLAYAKANPGKINSATVGLGTVQHLVNELLMVATGIKFTVVPYKGGGPAMTDLIGGQVQASINNLVNLAPHVKSGKVRPIAISGDHRNPVIPEMPTFAEAGLPGYVANNWFGMLAPAGTPRDILLKLNASIQKAQGMADVKDQLNKQGIDPYPTTVPQFEQLLKVDLERYGKVIKEANIKADTGN